jgi:hypothetical protein
MLSSFCKNVTNLALLRKGAGVTGRVRSRLLYVTLICASLLAALLPCSSSAELVYTYGGTPYPNAIPNPLGPGSILDLGLLPYGTDVTASASRGPSFTDIYLFEVPRTAIAFAFDFDSFRSTLRLSAFDLYRDDLVVAHKENLLNSGAYFAEDPIQPSYEPSYVSSISGHYRFELHGDATGLLGGFYNFRVYANRNSFIPNAVPEPATLNMALFALLALVVTRRRTRLSAR